ncbi:hypothetical protein [Halobacillus sp. B23F22_1]|uniref:hypothetical protein n=1 Tax=Halobacillus sp. B23F22_1 TaxID=3459514 RepID=UPI00373F46F1
MRRLILAILLLGILIGCSTGTNVEQPKKEVTDMKPSTEEQPEEKPRKRGKINVVEKEYYAEQDAIFEYETAIRELLNRYTEESDKTLQFLEAYAFGTDTQDDYRSFKVTTAESLAMLDQIYALNSPATTAEAQKHFLKFEEDARFFTENIVIAVDKNDPNLFELCSDRLRQARHHMEDGYKVLDNKE